MRQNMNIRRVGVQNLPCLRGVYGMKVEYATYLTIPSLSYDVYKSVHSHSRLD